MEKVARVAKITVQDRKTGEVSHLSCVDRYSVFTQQFERVSADPMQIKALRDLPEVTPSDIIKIALARHLWFHYDHFGVSDEDTHRWVVLDYVVDFVEYRHWTAIPRKTKYHDSHNHKLCADYVYDVMHG